MPVENRVRLWPTGGPDGNLRIRTACDDAPILEIDNRIYRPVMKAQDLLGRVAGQRPANDGRVKAARHRIRSVRRNRQRLYRPAMAAQLRVCRTGREQEQQKAEPEVLRPEGHNGPIQNTAMAALCSVVAAFFNIPCVVKLSGYLRGDVVRHGFRLDCRRY